VKKYLKAIIALVVLITISFLFIALSGTQEPVRPDKENSTVSNKILEEYWLTRIEKVGGEKAYQEFFSAYLNETGSVQHTKSHLFGSALYKAEGLPGVSVCDQKFNFGCYHEFMGWAIREHGLDVAPSLNERCLDKHASEALGCQHGVGHGILASQGYEEKNLFDSLETCAKFRAQPAVGGCYGGVFMEFNLETILGDEGMFRDLNPTLGHHYPCSVVENQFKAACYYEQPQWWQAVFYKDWAATSTRLALFKKMGNWCNEAESSVLKTKCFLGLGNNAPAIINWNLDEMKMICLSMPIQSGRKECRGAAAAVMYGAPGPNRGQWRMCEDGTKEEYEECVSLAMSPR
jgi:hypothetical protein